MRSIEWRDIVVVVLILAFLIIAARAVYFLITVNRGMSLYELESEVARLASTLFFSKLTTIAQLTVALIGAAWAFRTFGGAQIRIRGWHATTCFWLTNLSFGMSLLVFYGYGYDFIVGRMFHHLTFDIDAPFVRLISNYQLIFFVLGCLYFVITVTLGTKRAGR